jgi:hypothetical protein
MKYLALLVFTLLIFNGCTKEIYIEPEYPKLKVYNELDFTDIELVYEVYNEDV